MKKRGRRMPQPMDVKPVRGPKKAVKQALSRGQRWLGSYKKLVLVVAVLALLTGGVAFLANDKQEPPTPTGAAANFAKQLPELSEAVQASPNDPNARKNYAVALYATKDVEGAREQYEAAAKLNDQDATTFNNLGNVYRDLGKFEDALKAYRKALELDPKALNPYINLAHVQLYSLNKPDDAIATYEQALGHLPGNEQIEILLGIAYEQKGDIDSARTLYEEMLERNPGNATAKTRLERLNQQE